MPDYGYNKDSLRGIIGLSGEFVGTTDTATLTNKTINTSDNTVTATSQAAGDILVNNATKYVRLGIGTAGQPLKVNSGATTVEYGTLPVAGGGSGAATFSAGVLKASGTTAFTTVAAPTGALIGDTDTQNFTTGPKTFFSQIQKFRNPANTFSGTMENPALTADADLNYFVSPYAYIVYRVSSSVFKVIDCALGRVVYNGSSALTALQTARDGMASSTTPLSTGTVGGRTLIKKGVYTLTAVDGNDALFDVNQPGAADGTAAFESMQMFEGEGPSTEIDLTPSVAVNTGIRLRGWHNALRHMKIKATNTNITNIVRVEPGYFQVYLEDLFIQGPSKATAGMTGILMNDWPDLTRSAYDNTVRRIRFSNVEKGLVLGGDPGTGSDSNINVVSDIHAYTTDYAIWCEGQTNLISNVYLQGNSTPPASGKIAVYIALAGADHNALVNIISENDTSLFAADTAATVIVASGALNNSMRNINNTIGPAKIIDLNVGSGASSTGSNRIRGWPQAVKSVTVTASPFTFMNQYNGLAGVYVGSDNGPITKIEYIHGGVFTDLKMLTGSFVVENNDGLRITYTGTAPTMKASVH